MKKILVAVDDTKGSLPAVDTTVKLFPCVRPETVVLLHVEKIEGRSVMDELLLSDSEVDTLKESLAGTDHQAKLDERARKVIDFFTARFEEQGIRGIKPVIREGHPAEEILKVAREEGVEMIVVGSRGQRLHNIFMGSVSREIANNAEIPVLIAK